jgi:parvulin-like peptidyl-prolyl isomerase
MAKVAKLDPIRKAKLKQNVLDELSKQKTRSKQPVKKPSTRATAVPPAKLTKPILQKKVVAAAPVKSSVKVSVIATPGVSRRTAVAATTPITARRIAPRKALPVAAKKMALAAPEVPLAITEKSAVNRRLGNFLPLLLTTSVIVLGLFIFDIVGLYLWQFTDPLSHHVARTFNLPAGNVNGQTISLDQYLTDKKAVKKALNENREGLRAQLVTSEDELFNRQVAHLLIAQELAKRNRSITSAEIDAQLERLRQESGSEASLVTSIKKGYGMTISEFRVQIIEPLLARERLQELLIASDNAKLNQAARAKAEEALNLARQEGADFSTLSKQYNQDEASINTGGSLGWITRGASGLPTAFEDALFAAPVGSVYPELIKSNAGYHIIKIEARATNPDDGRESLQARHILIRIDVDLYIKELLDTAVIKKYIT